MKKLMMWMLACWTGLAGLAFAGNEPDIDVKNVAMTGEIKGENVTFVLDLTVVVNRRGAVLPVADGRLVYLEGELPGRIELQRHGAQYSLQFNSRGEQQVKLTFAAAPDRQGDWRETRFPIPETVIRQVIMICDRDDLEIQFDKAVQMERRRNKAGLTEVAAFLNPGVPLSVKWKPQVRKLSGELAVTCDGNTVALASVGALKLNTLFNYRVVQGALDRMSLTVPDQLNVTQVTGVDIREWRLETLPSGERRLNVVLSRPQERVYTLRVEGERVLPSFPCKFELPVVVPRDVIRANGFLLLGTDSAVKLMVGRAAGLSQIDPGAFPRGAGTEQVMPAKVAYAYQYAHMPFQMDISAEDIVTAMSVDSSVTVGYEDNGVSLAAALDLEVRDAPAREVVLVTEPGWSVAQVQGEQMSDYDVRDVEGRREIRIYFRDAVLGHTLINLRLERSLGADLASFTVPRLDLRGARSERGYVVLSAEKGTRLKEQKAEGIREIHTASVPFRVPDAQRAYRFKSPDWVLQMAVEQTDAAIHAEVFQLLSLGEGALYGSVSATYRIEGAPVRRFVLKVPATCQSIEFTGRDVRSWQRDGDLVTVALQEKVLGDYTLLMTYNQPFAYEGAELLVGGVETVSTMSEVGYVALSGAASLTFEAEKQRDASVIPIQAEELPREYALLVNDPVLKAYKFVRAPHMTRLVVRRFDTQAMLDCVADHVTLRTRLSREGEAITEATYFVKNSSRQFMGLVFPQNAKLWSAKVDGESVQVLSGEKGMTLIPIKRLADADTPLRIDLVYAEERPALAWFKGMTFQAPLSAAQSVFDRWTLTVPDKLSLWSTGGTMTAPVDAADSATGLVALMTALKKLATGLARECPLLILWLGILAVAAVWIAYRFGKVPVFNVGTAAVVVLMGTLLIGMARLAFREVDDGIDVIQNVACRADMASREISFVKSVTMAERELSVSVRVVPSWLGGTGGLLRLVAGSVAGLLLLVAALGRSGRGKALPFAAGMTLLVWSLMALPVLVPFIAGLLLLVPLLWLAVVFAKRAYRRGRAVRAVAVPVEPPAEMPVEVPPPPPAPEEQTPPEPPAGPSSGLPSAGLALSVLLLLCGLAPASVEAAEPVFPHVLLRVTAPDPVKDSTGNAEVELTLTLDTDKPERFMVFPSNYVLMASTVLSKQGRITSEPEGFFLNLDRPGKYKLTFRGLVRVSSEGGIWSYPLSLPANLKNRVEVTVPAAGWEIASSCAALLNVGDSGKTTVGTMTIAGTRRGTITWQPRERKTKLEQIVFYCDLQTYAVAAPGLVNMTHVACCQVAQGELQTLRVAIPQGMSVTAVTGAGLGTWRFDPDTRIIEAWMEKPVSGEFTLSITTQIPQGGLPYDAAFSVPSVEGCIRQRGSVAVAAGNSVQVRLESLKGLSPMNVGDFSGVASQSGLKGVRTAEQPEIRSAYRYHELPVSATVHAERVLPEIRVTEQSSLDISDERMVLSSRLVLAISRAGIFEQRLKLPEAFDIESLSGEDISHWDEVREGGHGVIIHFRKQALGARTVNVVLGRMEKGIENRIAVPHIGVPEAVKHVGTLSVSGERGVRLLTTARDGVSEMHPRELGIEQAGVLAFRILRPDWAVTLNTESLLPVLKADVLQRVDISEGMIHGRSLIQYKIDQAGVKVFRLKAPAPGVALTVAGRGVAKVTEVDRTNGLWEVELQGKVENHYQLDVSYQQALEARDGQLKVSPLRTVDTESQKGYLVAFSSGRLQVKAAGVPAGLREDDARNVPATFGAGNLADAVLCYRTTRPDYELLLSVVRHDSAEVLAARVDSVGMTSVLSDDGQMLTRMVVAMNVGSLRFLEVTLPATAKSWSAFVAGTATVPLKDRGRLLIPLDAARNAGQAIVELSYVSEAGGGSLFRRQRLEGPRFNVPLANVRWDVYAPAGFRYYGFDGTMRLKKEWRQEGVTTFDATQYETQNRALLMANNVKAETVLKEGESLWKAGKQAEAKQALKQAVVFSQGKQELNEDARIQYRNLMRQQAVVGFYNRRSVLKKAKNVMDPDEASAQGQHVQEGQWTADYGRQLEQRLDNKDTDNLNLVADKMLEQQDAAQIRANPIRVTLPVQGVHLPFARELQINPGAEMVVEFKASGAQWMGWLTATAAALALMAAFWALMRVSAPRA
jgi:hypothetical protein